MSTISELTVSAGGLRFRCLHAGGGDRLALLVHGFPDDAGTWSQLLPALAQAGYHAIAPWTRGYGETERAADGRYDVAALGGDLVALRRALGHRRAAIVGHDWGAVAGYVAVNMSKESFDCLVTMAVPPPRTLLRDLVRDPAQLRRSWYVGRFQLPGAAARLRRDDLALVDRLWRDWSPGLRDARERVAAVKRTLSAPGSVEAALSYYRQLLPHRVARPVYREALRLATARVEAPTLVIAGDEDGCIGPRMFNSIGPAFAAAHELERVAGAGHFMHLERPELIASLVRSFLDRHVDASDVG
ncbi:MAG: alpha/beta hydrolase [Myxococcales bacterium]|nr:alpha/beta hydrolase [Myxococcales bacterium]